MFNSLIRLFRRKPPGMTAEELAARMLATGQDVFKSHDGRCYFWDDRTEVPMEAINDGCGKGLLCPILENSQGIEYWRAVPRA